jgi:pyrimidine-specific ribonucleoside hydrolase
MKNMLFLLLVLLFSGTKAWSKPLPVKSKHVIIIDTDCAIDDLRAISMLLSRPEIMVSAILLSDGSLPPEEGFDKVVSLLHYFGCDTIPVGTGSLIKGINPPWRQFNRQIIWAPSAGHKSEPLEAFNLLKQQLDTAKERTVLVCMGPLSNIYRVIKDHPSVISKIERIIWYNPSANPIQGFNYSSDPEAADYLLKSGIRIDMISNLNKEEALIDSSMVASYNGSETCLSDVLCQLYTQPCVIEKLRQRHFRLTDDLLPVYLTNPELFDMNIQVRNVKIRYNQDYNAEAVKEVLQDMKSGAYIADKGIALNGFPYQRQMYTYDVRQIIDSAISRYGTDEWKANVLTDEFHGHLGVFSIVGSKMGIRAREYFNVGPDELEVVSFAGSRPPYSCLNDGIQVSTGATLGMGTIHLANDSVTRPSAIFRYGNRTLQLTLKQAFLEQVDRDIREGIVKFGLLDDGYWKLVRINALKYWLEWNRNEIFELIEL